MEDGALQKQYQPIVGNPSPRCVAVKRMATTIDDSNEESFGILWKEANLFLCLQVQAWRTFFIKLQRTKNQKQPKLRSCFWFLNLLFHPSLYKPTRFASSGV